MHEKQAPQQKPQPVAPAHCVQQNHQQQWTAPTMPASSYPAYQPPAQPAYQPAYHHQSYSTFDDQNDVGGYSRQNDPTMTTDATASTTAEDWAQNLNSTFSSISQAVSKTAAEVASTVNKAIHQEEVDTGAEFVKRGHKMMEAHYDDRLRKWVFPGEDPNAPTEEELRAQRLAALPPPPTGMGGMGRGMMNGMGMGASCNSIGVSNGFNDGQQQPLYEAVATHNAVLRRP